MVRLRKSHTKLKIALCSVCGFFVAIGGVLGIWVLSSALQGEKEVVRPEDTVSVRKELPSGGTYSELKSDGLDTLGYLAYVLDQQEFYHSESSTSSVAMIATQTTQSFKDYKDGIMLSSDFTYGFVSAGTQSCFVPGGNENGEGAGVYMRTSNGSVNSSSTGTNTNWNDDVRYYPEEEYLYTYGQYSTEMTVYILNDETVTSWDEVRDNGDGTYSQKFYLDAEKAAYYYQYAMKTRGGLDTLPIFKSVTLDITFDDSYHVLEIDAVEDTNITYIFSMDSTSTTTTTYSYDEVSFDQPHRDLYDAYYKDYVGKLQSGDNEEEQIDVISLLAGAFANVLNGQGQQFDATLTLGNTPYYGRVYLNVDMGGISSGDILGAIEARIQLSADQSFDSQDLYIELSDGKVSGYYSTGFALTADINSFGDIIDKFETWISTLDFGSSSDGGTDGEGEGEDQPDEGEGDSSSSLNDILEQLLGGLVLEESEGGVSVSLDISDLLGIGLSAKLDFTASEGADGTTEYSFASADIGGITYGGENIALSLGLAPSAAENISHDESETPFNVNEAADSLYQLLSSQTLKLRLSLEGAELADFASAIGIVDPGDSLDNLKLEVEGGVALDGLTVNAAVRLIDTSAEKTLLDADVYYIYNGSSGAYGTAYLAITNLLGVECDAKVYCDIADLADTITKLVASFSGEGDEGSEEGGAAALAEDGSDLVSVINGVLSLDFGSVIKELTANNTVIGATVNADEILALLGIDVTLGDITLEYSLGDFDAEDYNTEGGWLHGSVPSLGAEVYVYGSTLAIDEINFEEYLDLDVLLGSVIGVLSSETVTVDLTVTGGAVADILAGAGLVDLGASLDGLTLNVSGGVSISSLPSALAAQAKVNLTNGDLPYVVADVFYAYEEGGMGTAYITITNLLGADLSASPVKVKCDISDAVTAIEQLIGAVEEVLPVAENGQSDGEGNDIASIISGVLAIDFGSIIKELTINADVLSTTIDADNLIAMFSDVSLGLGEITLEYNTEGALTGSALNGEVVLEVSGSDSTLTAPDDSEFLDINEVLNTVTDILTNKLVALSLNLDETGLANLLKGVGAEDYVTLAEGLGLTVDGTLDIEQLAAIVSITLTRNEETLLAGQIYYDYDEAPDGETSYGTAQLYITNVLGAACDIKVKCDIAGLAESIQQIIAMFSAPDPNEPAPTSAPEADNTVVGIISEILELDFPAIIEKLTANASGFETEIDVDALLGELEVTGISLGKVTLKYDTATEKLTGSALGGLTLEAYKGTQEVKPIDGNFLDLNEVLNTVKDILENKLVALSLNLDETGLETLLKGVGAEDYVSLAKGLGLTVDGTLDIEQLAALVNITLTRGEETLLAGQIYYDYNNEGYGTAQLYITNVFGATCDIKVKCDIAELAESIQQIIAMFTQSPSMQNDAPEADNTIVGIISEILELNFPAIIEKLTANASGFETEIDVDALLGELEVTGISLGTVTLKYDTATEKLTGSALGGLTLEAYKGTITVEPIKGEFLDLNEVLNTVTDILTNKLVALSLNLDETGLETLLKGVGAEDYVSLAKGLGLTVDGTLDIEQLAALVNITLTRGEETLLAGQIYYDYNNEGYGTAQLYITNVLGAECDIKVKCDIAELAESIQQIIAMFTQSPSMQNDAPEADNTIVGIISEILELNFPAIIEKLTANASGFETEIDVDALLGELEVTGISLGTVTLKYDTGTEKLTGSALGGLTLEAYKGTTTVEPIKGEFLDLNEVLNTVTDILTNKLVTLSLNLDEAGLANLLKGVGAEDYVSLAKGLGLTVDGTLDIEQLAALVNITLTRGEETLLAGQIYYEYTEAETEDETSYGTANLWITNVFGAKCDIKVKCDIAELAESIQQIIAMFTQSPSMQNDAPEADNTIVGIISEILELNFPAIIEKLTANASGFETEIDVDALLGELEVTGITLGTVTLKYDTATEKLTGSALGGLTLEAYKGTQEVKPIDGEFLDINEVIEIALAVSEQVQAIINEEQIHFDIDAGATIDGVAVGIDGSAAVDWVGGTLNKLAVTATLSLQNSGEANRSATAFTFLYNNGAADSDPYIRIGIGDEVLNITKGDIATVSAQIGDLKVQIEKLIDVINGGSAQSDGETAQIVAEIARLSGISAITVDGGDGSIKEPDAVIIVNALLDALLGANENGENVLADIFGAIMSGTSVSADDLSLAVKMLFENIGASLSIGLDNGGRLSLGGTVTSGGAEVADLHISAKSGLGGVFEKIDGSLDELKQNSSSEEVSFIKIVYDYLFKAIGNVNIGDYLGSDAYKVSFRLGGDGSKIPELAGVQVTADLYFAGNYQGGNLIRADISNLTVDGFNLSADVVYLNNTLYIDLENIDGTALSGLKVQVQADDIYKAVENIIALIKNDKVINFFGSVAGSFRTSGGEGQEAAGAAVTLSEEQEKTFTDILVALLSLDYSEVVKISSADGATTITADIDAVLEAVGVDVSVGSAQIVAEKDRLTVGLSHENSNYNWIQLVAERSESLNFDTSSLTGYIDIGFVADIVDDAGKFITSNAPADGEISTLFTLNGGTIAADVDISDIDFSSALGDEWWSGIVGAVLKGLDIDPITISNIDLVIGLDSAGELYFSLEGDLSAVSVTALGFIPIEFVAANSIGITYSDGLITLKKDSGGSPIYWVMTPEYFIDNLFAEQSDENGTDSPIRWLLGTGSSIWNLIASNLGGLIDIDSGITSPDEITLYPVSNGGRDGGNEEATALSQFLAGYAINLGEENAYTYGGYSAALERLGLKDSNNYYAFALNASGLTGGMLDALDVALLRDETYGFGGLKAYASVMSGAVVVNFNIGYSGYKAPTDSSVPANYYENAVGSLSDAARQEFDNALTLNNDVTANINGIDTVYAYDVFGGVKIEGGVLVTVNTQREYVDELLTVTVYESVEDMEAGVNAATYKVRYGSVINLHDDWNIMSDDDGNVYVYVAAGDTSGTYPETYTVENDTVFYKTTVSGEEWTTAKVTINGQTFVVKHGTSLNDIVANKFGGYGVVDGWKQVMSDDTRQDYTATAVTEDVELEVQFARLSVTAENGVVYTLGGGTQGEGVNTVYDHYEVTGYTQAISAYYEENTTLVLENEVDGVPVTAIAANALQYRGNGQGLQNVVVPENITTIGGRAFLDNYGIKSVVFLADTITLNNNDAENSGTKGYPFYGCTLTNGGETWALNVYYKNISNLNSETFIIRNDNISCYSHSSGWIWLDYNITLNGSGYGDNFGEFANLPAEGTLVTSLGWNGGVVSEITAAQIEEYVTSVIDAHTYAETGNQYIVGYDVAVSNNISLVGGVLEVGIEITSTDKNWYPVTVNNNAVNGITAGAYAFDSYKRLGDTYFLEDGAEVTLTATASGGYELISVSGNVEGTAEGNTYKFVAGQGVVIDITWAELEINSITVYSDVSFYYNGAPVAGESNNYYITEDLITATGGLSSSGDVVTSEGYYFLGWAQYESGTYTFVSDLTVDYELEGVSYYAIWGYGGSNVITGYAANGDLSKLGTASTSAEGVTFYGWYSAQSENFDESYKITDGTISGTTVYARWSYKLDFTLSGKKTRYYVTMNKPNASEFMWTIMGDEGLTTSDSEKIDYLSDGYGDSNGNKIDIPEMGYIEVSRGDSSNILILQIFEDNTKTTCVYSISIRAKIMKSIGIASWEDGDRLLFDGNENFSGSTTGTFKVENSTVTDTARVWLTAENVSQNMEFLLKF